MCQHVKENDYSVLCDFRSTVTQEFTEHTFRWLINSVYSNTYRILRDESNHPIGYIIWASICKDSFLKISHFGGYPKYSFEWQEGNITLILEIVINDSDKSSAFKQLRQFIKSKKILTFINKNRGKLYLKKNNKRCLTTTDFSKR